MVYTFKLIVQIRRHGDVISLLDLRWNGLGSSPSGALRCVLGQETLRILYVHSRSFSLHPGVYWLPIKVTLRVTRLGKKTSPLSYPHLANMSDFLSIIRRLLIHSDTAFM